MEQGSAPELVSVVIPARNAAATIGEQLASLELQDYEGVWEVVVADNGSSDNTAAIACEWATRLPGLRVVDASARRGASFARNVGVANASGEFLAFCDADDVVAPEWLTALVAAAPGSDMVSGPLDLETLNDEAVRRWIGWTCPTDRLAPAQGFLLTAYGGCCGIWRSAFDRIGGWNVEYGAFDDRELSWRLQLAGLRLNFAPGAFVRYRMRSDVRTLWRKSYRDGKATVQIFRAYRAMGAPRSKTGRALRAWAGFVRRLPELGKSRARRGAYLCVVAQYAGHLVGSIRFRTLYL